MKLSEFVGQEHITSVLRASVIKHEPLSHISIAGDRDLAAAIFVAYQKSLDCENTTRGDHCDECGACVRRLVPVPKDFVWSFSFSDNAVNFEVKTTAGQYVDPELLTLLIYAYQADRAELMKHAKTVALTLTFDKFSAGLISILSNILYLKSNLEITETDKIEALRALSVRLSTFDVTSAIRLLWDSQSQGVLPDQLRVETASLLLSEVFQPTPTPDKLVVQSDQTPIKVVEEDILEQPLDLNKMLEIAHS